MKWRLLVVCASLCAVMSVRAADIKDILAADVENATGWIYDDVKAGFAEAAKSGKPLLFLFRCVR